MGVGSVDRRDFLKLLGVPAAAAAIPLDLEKVMAIPANNKTGSIDDVEHVIFLMQENRSFDHYFGTLRGVRGFNDPRAVRLPNGKLVWHQPGEDGSGELLPFRPKVPDVGQMFLPDPPHGWIDTHAAWNGGRHDQFPPNKGVQTMAYHRRKDLSWHYALADAFTVCDNYHCSLLGPTDPNRYHMWTGWVGNDGKGGGPVITNAEAGYDWSTYPERLLRNGVSWHVYQDIGDGLNADGFWGWTGDPFIGNYGCNSLLYFHRYQNAAFKSPIGKRAKQGTNIKAHQRNPDRLFDQFRADVKNDTLPQVSWIAAPEAYCEHPNWQPDYGTWYVSQIVDILASNPDVWSKMALFIMYDEEGGFFDHLVPPTPPTSASDGKSTVPTTNEIYPGDAFGNKRGPYGVGMRVPMIVVSPWTRGGWVDSELFDHTSMIRFLERRFGRGNPDLIESNITPWRRAVVGDLTSAFDFKTPNRSRHVQLPDTDDLMPSDLERQPDNVPVPPVDQSVPRQERGVRPARALPYQLHADGNLHDNSFEIDLDSAGDQAAVFQVRSGDGSRPRTYTVGAGKQLSDSWDASAGYDLAVHGPNGFYRSFVGAADTGIAIRAWYEPRHREVVLRLANRGDTKHEVKVADAYRSRDAVIALRPGKTVTRHWQLTRTRGWYDLLVTIAGDADFAWRYAGHLENGHASISDPLMGGLI